MVSTNEMIFGVRAVLEALDAGKEIDKILVKRDIQSDLSRELFSALKGRTVPVVRVPQEKLNRITRKNHQGVIAYVSAVEYARVDNVVPTLYEEGKTPLLVLLDGITDVRNFGSIARTCDCAGVDAVVIPSHNSVTVNADAVKTSAGALHTLPVCREKNITETLKYLKESGVRIVCATEKGKMSYTQCDYTAPVCIVMGAEDTGIPLEHLRLCDDWVSIPQFGNIASLNVSVATGVVLYEAVRQRHPLKNNDKIE